MCDESALRIAVCKAFHEALVERNVAMKTRDGVTLRADIYRPAAVKQLQVLGEQIKIPVFTLPPGEGKSPPTIARNGW